MRIRNLFVFAAVILVCGLAAADRPKNERFVPLQPRDEFAETASTDSPVMHPRGPIRRSLDEPIGVVDTAGFTWYDEQQYTTMGKQIAMDREGYAHHVWTKGLNNGSSQRHIYYNAWDPNENDFVLPNLENNTGVAVENSIKAGYANVAVNRDGFAFPTFHQITEGTVPHAAVAIDLLPHAGGFSTRTIPFPEDRRIVYPKIACDTAGFLHVAASHGTPVNMGFYARGQAYYTDGIGDSVVWPDGLVAADSTYFLTRDITASYQSNRIAIAWLFFDSRAWFGINLFVKTSDDGGLTWNDPINVTNYPPIDTNCVNDGGAIAECNQDTLRPSVDLSLIFDQDDVLHVAFTARYFYYWDEDGTVGPWIHNDGISSIWHWDEQNQEFNIIAERPYGTLVHSPGATQVMCQRPNLAVDTTTGFLYCSYQAYDTNQWSEMGYTQADAWISVSTTGGRTWSAGTNVTATNGGQDATPGNSLSERDINLAQFVTDGIIHMQYQLDMDAGTAINSEAEGTPTLNPILYQRIPTDQIPLRPLTDPYRILRQDSTGYPWGLDTTLVADDHPHLRPDAFVLFQNYPNPFNSNTTIQFDLAKDSRVNLAVFDVLGREVAALFDNVTLAAGAHTTSFNASELSSGIYFYRLEAGGLSQTRKMMLIR